MSTSTATKDQTRPTDTGGNDDGLTHIYCKACNPDKRDVIALCGKDVSDRPDKKRWSRDDRKTCLVCEDLWNYHRCSTHGARP